jgi:hypothetical protein
VLSIAAAFVGSLLFAEPVLGQGNSLDVPQTRLAPIGGVSLPENPPYPGAAAGAYNGSPPAAGAYNSSPPAAGAYNGSPPSAVSGGGLPQGGYAQNTMPGQVGAPGQGSVSGNGIAPTGSLFDPYAGGPSAGYMQPSVPPGGALFNSPFTLPQGGLFGQSSTPATGMGTPTYSAPMTGGASAQPPPTFGGSVGGGGFFGGAPLGGSPTIIPSTGYAGPGFAGPSGFGAPPGYDYPPSAYPGGAPSTLFPGGVFGTTPSYSPQFNPYRLIQRTRFRHEFIYGGNDLSDLEINNTDVALAFAFPRFLFSNQPLFVAPSFSLHLFDGPSAQTGADLPASTYSAFLDFGWQSDPNQIVGAELGVSFGAFTEFDHFRSDGFRVRGKGLGSFRITPASTFKLGVYYYDRVDIKLLPAGGLIWRPNPYTKFDIFFPQPKFSRYLSTIGVHDVWWYLSGDYGGGSWSIDRDDGRPDQVDVNDIRLMLGFEWGLSERIRYGVRSGFFEFGYLTGRELVYRYNQDDNLSLDDTWMVRLGIGY